VLHRALRSPTRLGKSSATCILGCHGARSVFQIALFAGLLRFARSLKQDNVAPAGGAEGRATLERLGAWKKMRLGIIPSAVSIFVGWAPIDDWVLLREPRPAPWSRVVAIVLAAHPTARMSATKSRAGSPLHRR